MEEMMKLVFELVEAGVQMNLVKKDGETRAYFEDGFYKSDGCAYLIEGARGDIQLHSRYDTMDQVGDLEDVAIESHNWFERSRERHFGWSAPAEGWIRLYERFNLI